MSELVESTVRKHCAMWETGASPGSFGLLAAPPALFPVTGESCALEAVVRYNGDLASQRYLTLYQVTPTVMLTVYEFNGSICVLYETDVPVASIACNWAAPVPLTWYHALAVLVNDGADNMRVQLYIDGTLEAESGVPVAADIFTPAASLKCWIGFSIIDPSRMDLALVRDWIGAWPSPSDLPNKPWYPPGTTGLRGQWDFSPGAGNTIYDSGPGGYDMPWIAGTQANASYAHYRFTGQPRGQLWQPR